MLNNYDNNAFEDGKTRRVVYGVTWFAAAGLCGYFVWWWATAV